MRRSWRGGGGEFLLAKQTSFSCGGNFSTELREHLFPRRHHFQLSQGSLSTLCLSISLYSLTLFLLCLSIALYSLTLFLLSVYLSISLSLSLYTRHVYLSISLSLSLYSLSISLYINLSHFPLSISLLDRGLTSHLPFCLSRYSLFLSLSLPFSYLSSLPFSLFLTSSSPTLSSRIFYSS